MDGFKMPAKDRLPFSCEVETFPHFAGHRQKGLAGPQKSSAGKKSQVGQVSASGNLPLTDTRGTGVRFVL